MGWASKAGTAACAFTGAAVAGTLVLGNRVVEEVFVAPAARRAKAFPGLSLATLIERKVGPCADAEMSHAVQENADDLHARALAWLAAATTEHVVRVADGGQARLTATIVYADRPGRRWAILAHGAGADRESMMPHALLFARRGYNVLAVDLRGCGESGGKYRGMGFGDADDMLDWADYLVARFGADCEIVMMGVSAGAAAALVAASRRPYPQVKAIISDSAYASLGDVVTRTAHRLRLPAHLVLASCEVCFLLRGGYSIMHASVVDSVRDVRVPVLFVHGAADDFVPSGTAARLYACCGSQEKRLKVFPGAGHALSLQCDPQGYEDVLDAFLEGVGL